MDTTQGMQVIGGLSDTSKMPWYSWSLDARRCQTGSKLRKIPGSICFKCYGFTGFYNMPVVKNAMERRYQALKNPLFTKAFTLVLKDKAARVAEDKRYFRWFDDGDLQSLKHLRMIVAICKSTPEIAHWLPTKEYGIVKKYLAKYGDFPSNLTVRLSAYKVDGPHPSWYPFTSGVHTVSSKGAYECPAYRQGHQCLDCRACWSKAVPATSYLEQ